MGSGVYSVSFIHGGLAAYSSFFFILFFSSHFIVSLFLCILRFDLYPCLYRPWFSPGFFHLSGSVFIPQRPFYRYRRPRTLFSVYHLHICLSFLDIPTSPAHCSSVCTDTNRASRNVCYHSFDIYTLHLHTQLPAYALTPAVDHFLLSNSLHPSVYFPGIDPSSSFFLYPPHSFLSRCADGKRCHKLPPQEQKNFHSSIVQFYHFLGRSTGGWFWA